MLFIDKLPIPTMVPACHSTYTFFLFGLVPELFALIIGATFFFVTMMFCIYDLTVQRRNEKLLLSAAKSNTVLSNFFPTLDMRDRILEGVNRVEDNKKVGRGAGEDSDSSSAPPLADLFLETTSKALYRELPLVKHKNDLSHPITLPLIQSCLQIFKGSLLGLVLDLLHTFSLFSNASTPILTRLQRREGSSRWRLWAIVSFKSSHSGSC